MSTSEDFGELDDIGFLREADLFQDMPEAVIRTIVTQGHAVHFSTGEIIVKKGDPGDSLFVIKSGVVEVSNPADGPPLAYLGRGDRFGELALLTSSERTADIRVPQQAELLVIDRPLFNDLMTNHTGFGAQLAIILAQRLVKTLEDLPDSESKKELQGDLEYFDLATVVQTLISSAQTGVMTFRPTRSSWRSSFSRVETSTARPTRTAAVTKPFTTCFKRSRKASFSSTAKARKTSRTDQTPESPCPRWR